MKEIRFTTFKHFIRCPKKVTFRMSTHFFLQYALMLREKNNDGPVVDQSNSILKVTFFGRPCS